MTKKDFLILSLIIIIILLKKIEEFISFLHFFETKMKVKDTLYDGEELFKRFFDRKINADWSTTVWIIRVVWASSLPPSALVCRSIAISTVIPKSPSAVPVWWAST